MKTQVRHLILLLLLAAFPLALAGLASADPAGESLSQAATPSDQRAFADEPDEVPGVDMVADGAEEDASPEDASAPIVPEPATGFLALIGAALLFRLRRKS